jgi:hypothetical protein
MQINFLNPEYLFQKIYELLLGTSWFSFVISGIEIFRELLARYSKVSAFISIILLIGVGYSILRIRQIRKKENETFAGLAEVAPAKIEEGVETKPPNPKWEKVLEHISSASPADWRLAILEADIMLDELLDNMHYKGETIGDKLKKIEKSDFTSLDLAWEAHKIRNQVAHEGSEFLLSEREAKRVISLYEEVFKEFRFI